MFCPKCGKENKDTTQFCAGCGSPLGNQKTVSTQTSKQAVRGATMPPPHTMNAGGGQTINVNVASEVKKNGIGTAGFVFALFALFLFWIPVFGWILWFLGAIFSLIGLFRTPKGLAVAGTIFSFLDLIILVLSITACSSIAGSM